MIDLKHNLRTQLHHLVRRQLEIRSGTGGLPRHPAKQGTAPTGQTARPVHHLHSGHKEAGGHGVEVGGFAFRIRCDQLQSAGNVGLLAKANQLAGGLTLLNRKRLELARALCTQPKLLLLDEIAGGLTEHEAKILVDEIKAIKARGVTMIWIEHVVHALLAVADRLFVLNFGTRLAEGEPNDVMNDPEVKRVYMGLEA